MRMRVKLFSPSHDNTAFTDVEFPYIPGMQLMDLEKALRIHYPEFQNLTGRWAVNRVDAPPTYAIRPGDEIAFHRTEETHHKATCL